MALNFRALKINEDVFKQLGFIFYYIPAPTTKSVVTYADIRTDTSIKALKNRISISFLFAKSNAVRFDDSKKTNLILRYCQTYYPNEITKI